MLYTRFYIVRSIACVPENYHCCFGINLVSEQPFKQHRTNDYAKFPTFIRCSRRKTRHPDLSISIFIFFLKYFLMISQQKSTRQPSNLLVLPKELRAIIFSYLTYSAKVSLLFEIFLKFISFTARCIGASPCEPRICSTRT